MAEDLVIAPRPRPVGNGQVRRLLPFRLRRMVGPFVFCDLMGPDSLRPGEGMDVDAHPHIGLSTVTYLFAGRLVHRDSTGAVATIEPGAVNWMTAGRGVCHTERSHPEDRAGGAALHGVQTWVALPDDTQDGDPSFQHAPAGDIPAEVMAGSQLRVAAGTGWGLASPVAGSSPLVLAELTVRLGSPVAIDDEHAERAVLAVEGSLTVDDRPLPTGHLAVLEPGRRRVGGDGLAVVLGGAPVGPRHIWWNFVHADPERIEAAKADWMAQRFPLVPDDHTPWVPLPG